LFFAIEGGLIKLSGTARPVKDLLSCKTVSSLLLKEIYNFCIALYRTRFSMISALTPQRKSAELAIFSPQAHSWVMLRDPLTEYSDEQALLLCEEADGRWVAWIPGYGEARLERKQMLSLD
jgi:hypothetical protein